MPRDDAKLEEAALIRSRFNEAIQEAYIVYCGCEEVAAYAVLEIFRLENMSNLSHSEDSDRLERLKEKTEVLARTKDNMHFILDKIHGLARDRDRYIADIYMSRRIVDLEEKLSNLTPWIQDLSTETQDKAEAAKLYAKITSEISAVNKFPPERE
jgi:hypothetical protein